ncbi:EAL domain-containing protein [Alteromonas pelagimontana]|uniref:EAL domain-containing protein n=1 Tax=Alteromonas pelagimontana TaxID=1858656 RepID=A0A6M4M9H6_9ALTE|nr:EAL domain-containing protein [Alteromonas pelagimontana]QJR79777.1 EAL domain-containing protein [Alteromonas pelagimontana]
MFLEDQALPKILLVDDQPTVIHQLNNIVKDFGKTYFATNGRSALEMVHQHKPDLVLLDIEMPDFNGYDVCRAIKAIDEFANISIIFITSRVDPASEVIALELGGIDFISKPIVPEVVRARIKNHLSLARQRQELQRVSGELGFLVSSLPVFVAYWDAQLNNLFCNDSKGSWFGIEALQMRNMALRSVVGGQIYHQIIQSLDQSVLQDIPSFDINIVAADGRSVVGQVALAGWNFDPGASGYLMVITDISERKQAEQCLEEEKERIRTTLNSIGDAVIATDTQGRITLLNPVAEELTGWSAARAIGKPIEAIMQLTDGEAGPPVQNPIRLALEEERPVGMALNTFLSNRLTKSIGDDVTAAPIVDQDGNITGTIIVFHNVSEARAMATKMTHLAHHDPLTNLPNRTLLYDRIQQALNSCHREGSVVALFLLDIDHFKAINDVHGHVVGDNLIKQVALALAEKLRDGDTLCRQGGDEFIMLFPRIESTTCVTQVAERLLDVFDRTWTVDENAFRLTASIGISLVPDDAEDVESLYRHADAAMYSAKSAGRKQFLFYSADIESKLQLHRMLEANLVDALANKAFEVFYQPKINVLDGKIVGTEALVRWRQPDGSLTNPASFIPLAEETGLIIPLGKLVLAQAFKQASVWQQQGFDLRVAVNISVVQFEDDNFLAMLDEIVRETGVTASLIEMEITESLLVKDVERVNSIFAALNTRGFRIALDDFGTGYSNLSYIKNFPFDVLKIDQSFVRNMLGSQVDQNIIQAIIQLAQGMNLRLIAEGVETIEHVQALQAMGCEVMQGFYYSPPLPLADFNRLLTRRISLPE